ncbi:MAG TPA: VWA domain-containing protein [Thermoanaerobaculia bacterium]|nr:VWA domain-containing protein [Thermoanaerobaculia bacterium]
MRRCLIALALLAISAAVNGQTADEPAQTLTESYSVGYVMIPFTVLGNQGVPLTDLQQKEVSLLVDGLPVASDMFETSQNAPVSFTILLDGSGSMALAGKMDAARAAVATLLAHRKPGDDYSLWLFADDEAKPLVPFTEDGSAITRAMRTVKPFGKTAFFDALATMPERSRLGRNSTRAIILLSDGLDNASKLTRADIAARLEGVAIPIYPLGLREGAGDQRPAISDQKSPRSPDRRSPVADRPLVSEQGAEIDLLEEIARLTGGKLSLGIEPRQLTEAVNALEQNLRAQYLIGFTPTGKGAVKYRHISLQLAGRVRAVRVRAGYRGTEPPVSSALARVKPKQRKEGK